MSHVDLTDESSNESRYYYDEESNTLYENEEENQVSVTGSCVYEVDRKEIVVTIKGNSKTAQYDGAEKTVKGYTVESIQQEGKECTDYTSKDFKIKDAGKETVVGKDAGSYSMGLKPEDFENVNNKFKKVTFKAIDGQLNITKRNVTLTSASDEKSYDGQPLTNENIEESGDGFVEGEGVTYTVTGSQTEVGTSKNTFSYNLNANTKADNYEITTAEGTLTVTEKKHIHTYQEVITKATPSKNGSKITKCTECGDVQNKEVIAYPKKVSGISEYVYDGKAKKPEITVKDANGKKVLKSNYTLSYVGNCKNVGTHIVKITFKNNYSGMLKKIFKITPKKTNLKSVKPGKKQMVIQWSKQNIQTTGYQLQYATNKAFKKNLKVVNIKNNKVTSKKISKLAGRKKYYVRIRTYKKVAGKTYYSKWSTVKSVTTKK